MIMHCTDWRVVNDPPIRFRRAAGMQPLPTPAQGGSIAMLRKFLSVQSENDFILVVALVLAVLRNRGPYPGLGVSGEQGSGKTIFCKLLRALLDPNTVPSAGSSPIDEHDPIVHSVRLLRIEADR